MLVTIKRKKKKMRRLRGRRGRSEGYVVLSRGVNANMVTRADFLMMSKYDFSLKPSRLFCSGAALDRLSSCLLLVYSELHNMITKSMSY